MQSPQVNDLKNWPWYGCTAVILPTHKIVALADRRVYSGCLSWACDMQRQMTTSTATDCRRRHTQRRYAALADRGKRQTPDVVCRPDQISYNSPMSRFQPYENLYCNDKSRKTFFSTAYSYLNDSTAHHKPIGLTATRSIGVYSYSMAYDLLQHSGLRPELSADYLVNMRSQLTELL